MKNNKVLLLDLDGTALTHDYNISDELLLACKELHKKMNIFIVTGRSVSDAMRYYRKLKLNDYLICNNGAFILNPTTDDILYCEYMEDSKILINYLVENYNRFQLDNIIISSGINTYVLNDNNQYLCKMMYDEHLPYLHVTLGEIRNIDYTHRIILSTKEKNLEKCIKDIKQIGTDVDIFSWKGRTEIIDICMKSVNKWTGVKRVLKERNIMSKDVIAFGDARNDIPILEKSGVGIAMANADEHVKSYADYVTLHDNDNNGVYKFIKTNPQLFV